MAETETTQQEGAEETNGNGSNGGVGRTAVKAAAIAAVSGATALAAKKAFGDHGSDEEKQQRSPRKRGSDDVLGSMVSSAWESARDSLVPMIESAAGSAGEYLARNGPDVVRDTIVPKFIDGFERGRGSDDDGD
jgi:hypothetical protein